MLPGQSRHGGNLDNPAMAGTFIYTDLDMLSNKVNELIKDGRLAEAEDTCEYS
ncbi:MAG: hypothetical protein JRI48_08000 [Deltaproteobacteria bacterium]|nr:hypothetical protein [Deltaproteobacteria bacterium]